MMRRTPIPTLFPYTTLFRSSAAVRAVVDEVLAFQMPGAGIQGFLRKAASMARAGIYDLRVHRDEVLLPILRHWRIFELSRSEEHTSELQSRLHLVCRLLLEK